MFWTKRKEAVVAEVEARTVYQDEHGKWCISNTRRHYPSKRQAQIICDLLNRGRQR